jgi:hypothetical protein
MTKRDASIRGIARPASQPVALVRGTAANSLPIRPSVGEWLYRQLMLERASTRRSVIGYRDDELPSAIGTDGDQLSVGGRPTH